MNAGVFTVVGSGGPETGRASSSPDRHHTWFVAEDAIEPLILLSLPSAFWDVHYCAQLKCSLEQQQQDRHQEWWHTPLIPILWKQRQEDLYEV